jgi:hypothetical protein
VIEAASLDGSNGFTLNGIGEFDNAAHVSEIGDVNGDGLDDIAIGAQGADVDGIGRGQVYVLYGIPNPLAKAANLIEILAADVVNLALVPGVENPLLDKLFAAANVLENGNINSAVQKLVEFINLVNKKRGQQISDEEADQLIFAAEEIIALLESA